MEVKLRIGPGERVWTTGTKTKDGSGVRVWTNGSKTKNMAGGKGSDQWK